MGIIRRGEEEEKEKKKSMTTSVCTSNVIHRLSRLQQLSPAPVFQIWKPGILALLLKLAKLGILPVNYRLICLTPHVAKVYEKITDRFHKV